MENLHLVDGGDITHCNMFAELHTGVHATDVVLQFEKQNVFSFYSAFLSMGAQGRDVGGLACTHARMYICCAVCRVCSQTQCHDEHIL